MSPTPVLVMLRDPTLIGKEPVAVLVPENVTMTGPPFVAVRLPPLEILFTLSVMPVIVFVLTAPLIVTVPPVSVMFIEAADSA
jgi:hypothetical protein